MDGTKCRAILEESLLHSATDKTMGQMFHFQQDNDFINAQAMNTGVVQEKE